MGPLWPDNVEKTGFWSAGQSGFPVVAAEAEQVEGTQRKKDLVTALIRFLCLTQPPDSSNPSEEPAGITS
jgi:hypothetical protein